MRFCLLNVAPRQVSCALRNGQRLRAQDIGVAGSGASVKRGGQPCRDGGKGLRHEYRSRETKAFLAEMSIHATRKCTQIS